MKHAMWATLMLLCALSAAVLAGCGGTSASTVLSGAEPGGVQYQVSIDPAAGDASVRLQNSQVRAPEFGAGLTGNMTATMTNFGTAWGGTVDAPSIQSKFKLTNNIRNGTTPATLEELSATSTVPQTVLPPAVVAWYAGMDFDGDTIADGRDIYSDLGVFWVRTATNGQTAAALNTGVAPLGTVAYGADSSEFSYTWQATSAWKYVRDNTPDHYETPLTFNINVKFDAQS